MKRTSMCLGLSALVAVSRFGILGSAIAQAISGAPGDA